MLTGTWKQQIGNFKFCHGKRLGRMLRLTITQTFFPEGGGEPQGIAVDGCLVVRNARGALEFSGPRSMFGASSAKLARFTPETVRAVLGAVEASAFVEHIGLGAAGEIPAEDARDVDRTLPESMTVEAGGEK